jgi:hypothetical protein
MGTELVGSRSFSTRWEPNRSGRKDFRRNLARAGQVAKFFDETWRELVRSRSFSTKLGASWSGREVFRRKPTRTGWAGAGSPAQPQPCVPMAGRSPHSRIHFFSPIPNIPSRWTRSPASSIT